MSRPVWCTPGLQPCPGIDPNWSESKRAEAQRLIDAVHTFAPHLVEDRADADVEDYFEFAARIDAAVRGFGAENVWLSATNSSAEARRASDGQMRPVTELRGTALRYGPIFVTEEGRHGESPADRYYETDAFLVNAGRRILVGSITLSGDQADDPNSPDVLDFLAELAAEGHEDAVLKVANRKSGIWRIPISTDRAENRSTIMEVADWTAVRLSGMPNAWIAQEWVPFEYEYRLFCVDGIPETGAGCIVEFTPLDRAPDTDFDTQVRRRRGWIAGNGVQDPVESRPEIVAELLKFGWDIAGWLAPLIDEDFALDVAMVRGKPAMVELNGLSNSGLYASNPLAVTRALDPHRILPA